MCTKGVNVDQLKHAVGMSDDALAMVQQWLEQVHHLADHGDLTEPSTEIAQATVLLGEVRGKLEAAIDALDSQKSGPDATIEVV